MTELMTLYTAISYGNVEVALGCLSTFSETLRENQNNALKRNVYEMIRTTLTCITTEHPLQFVDEYIPSYNEIYTSHEENTLYHQLATLVQKFAVVEIAAECGYASLNSFYKAYKRIYGHAPTRQGADAE